jgi:hypothetical protein
MPPLECVKQSARDGMDTWDQSARERQTGVNLNAINGIVSMCAKYPALTVFDVMTVVQPLQQAK